MALRAQAAVHPAASGCQQRWGPLRLQQLGGAHARRAQAPARLRAAPLRVAARHQQQQQLEQQPCSTSAAPAPPLSSQQQPEQHQQQQPRPPRRARAEGGAGLRLFTVAAAAAGGLMGSGFSTDGPASVASAIGVLAAIIAIHECGHFAAARAQGIHVTEFSIGFGPQLWKRKVEGDPVEYSLRAIPLGGYVAFPDPEADPKSEYKPDDPDLLNNRPIGQRAIVISAGVVANIIFAYAVLFAQIGTVGKVENAYLPGVKVPDVTPGGVAERAGVRAGDVILRVGDYEVRPASDQVAAVVSEIKSHPNQRLDLVVKRGGDTFRVAAVVSEIKSHPNQRLDLVVKRGSDTFQVPVTPVPGRDGRGAIGVSLYSNTYLNHIKPDSIGGIFTTAGSEFNRIAGVVLGGLKAIITNFASVSNQISGPVAIVAKGSEIARTDSAGLFQFAAIVNINLAAVNLLPLPALDGGYLLLLAIEAARGKRLPQALEQGVMASGLLLMMALGVGLVIRDTMNLL